jgi:hypothetical protein
MSQERQGLPTGLYRRLLVDHSDAAPDTDKGEVIEGWGWVPRSAIDCMKVQTAHGPRANRTK